MKELRFEGDSLKRLRLLPEQVRRKAGYALSLLQHGVEPSDTKTLADVGLDVQRFGFGLKRERTGSSMSHDSSKPFMFCMCFRRRPRQPRSAILIW